MLGRAQDGHLYKEEVLIHGFGSCGRGRVVKALEQCFEGFCCVCFEVGALRSGKNRVNQSLNRERVGRGSSICDKCL